MQAPSSCQPASLWSDLGRRVTRALCCVSGEAREVYHGVPRVFDDGAVAAADVRALGLPPSVADYLHCTRINISIRNVK